jgi:hypothetical protein
MLGARPEAPADPAQTEDCRPGSHDPNSDPWYNFRVCLVLDGKEGKV